MSSNVDTAITNGMKNVEATIKDTVKNSDFIGGRNYPIGTHNRPTELANTGWTYEYFVIDDKDTLATLSGKKVLFHVDIDSTNSDGAVLGFYSWDSSGNKIELPAETSVKVDKGMIGTAVVTKTLPENLNKLQVSVLGKVQNQSKLFVHNEKLELGPVVTDWTPAPEDTVNTDIIAKSSNYGAENLVINSGHPNSTYGWGYYHTKSEGMDFSVSKPAAFNTNAFLLFNNNKYDNNHPYDNEVYAFSNSFVANAGEVMSYSVSTTSSANLSEIDISFLGKDSEDSLVAAVDLQKDLVLPATIPQKISGTFVVPSNVVSGRFRIDNNGTTNDSASYLFFNEVQVARESTPSPWKSPYPASGINPSITLGTVLTEKDDCLSLSAGTYTVNEKAPINTPTKSLDGAGASWGILIITTLPVGNLKFVEYRDSFGRIATNVFSGNPGKWFGWKYITMVTS